MLQCFLVGALQDLPYGTFKAVLVSSVGKFEAKQSTKGAYTQALE
jgi:hypothetical protein